MLRFSLCLLAASLLTISVCSAETEKDSLLSRNEAYELGLAGHLWMKTGNNAGLTLNPFEKGSIGSVTIGREYGDYHRSQEAQSTNQLKIHAEQFHQAGKYLVVRTLFDVEKRYEYDRVWSDVLRTYNSNPFFFGGDVKGRYDHLYFTLDMGIGSVEIGRFTFGTGLFYQAGNMSRLRDPRSTNNLEEYAISPSASFRLTSRHRVGIELEYRHRKESMPNIKILGDSDPYYYFYSGMENVEAVRSGYSSFQREFINWAYGIGLLYNYRNTRSWETLLSVNYQQGKESAWDSYKATPGKFMTRNLTGKWLNSYTSGKFLHTFDVNFSSYKGDADKYIQEVITVNNPITNSTNKYYTTLLIYNKVYQVETLDIGLNYRLFSNRGTADYNYRLGADISYLKIENRYNLPSSSFDTDAIQATVNGAVRVLNKSNARIWIEPQVSYLNALGAHLNLSDPTTLYATNVLIPDMNYYNASYADAQLGIKYQFPFRVKKLASLGYIELKGNHLWADNSTSGWGTYLTVGVFTW